MFAGWAVAKLHSASTNPPATFRDDTALTNRALPDIGIGGIVYPGGGRDTLIKSRFQMRESFTPQLRLTQIRGLVFGDKARAVANCKLGPFYFSRATLQRTV